jgi:hypothetical protein
MNLKPSPLNEASAVLAVAIFGIVITFSLTAGNVEAGFAMLSNSAIIFLLPAFSFWAVIGLFVRAKSKLFLMFTNIAISAMVTSLFSSLFISSIGDSTTGTVAARENAQAAIAGMSLVTFFWCLLGALLTYLWLLRASKN